MGTCTNIRVHVKIKKEYAELIKKIVLENKDWKDFSEEYSFLEKKTKSAYSKKIVNGWSAYAPEEWYEGDFDEEGVADGYETSFDDEKLVLKF